MFVVNNATAITIAIPKNNAILDTGVVNVIWTEPDGSQREETLLEGTGNVTFTKRVAPDPSNDVDGTDGEIRYTFTGTQVGLYYGEFRRSAGNDTDNTNDTKLTTLIFNVVEHTSYYATSI